jgi:hypothetical protein
MSSRDRTETVIRRVLSPGEPSNRLLRIGLGVLALVGSLAALGDLVSGYPWGADLEIPLRAAGRWLAGGRAYVPEAFANGSGYDLPFLYPPYALPLFAPLTAVARQPLQAAWFAAGLTVAVATCRWLGVQPRWIPLMLVWPPFAEGLISGNFQIATFAAFVFLLNGAGRGGVGPVPSRPRSLLARGLLGAATVFLKVSQPHVVVHLSRWDRRAAIVAMVAIASLVVATLPLTGTAIWMDWIDQIRRAADPGWMMGGPSLARLLPSPLGTLIVLACLAAVLAIPRAHAAAWVGVLLVLGAPSLHTYYLLFLLPAMLRIRREIALVAALLVTTYTEPGWWLAIAIVAGALALSRSHTGLLERPNAADGPVAAEQREAQVL